MSNPQRSEDGLVVFRLDSETEDDLKRLENVTDLTFNTMVRAARLNPSEDFIECDLSGLPLSGADLRGFNFTRARLRGTRLREATIDRASDFTGAEIDSDDEAAIAVAMSGELVPPPDFDIDKVYRMILSGKAPPEEWGPWIDKLNFNATMNGHHLTNLQPLTRLSALTFLDLSSTSISDVTMLNGLIALTHLELSKTNINDIKALADLKALKYLNLSNTSVKELSDIKNLTGLKRLNLRGTFISRVSVLAKFTELTHLNISDTYVENISALANLTKLTHLDLSSTNVRNVSELANCISLCELNLSFTGVTTLSPLAKLPALRKIYLQTREEAHELARTLGRPHTFRNAREWYEIEPMALTR